MTEMLALAPSTSERPALPTDGRGAEPVGASSELGALDAVMAAVLARAAEAEQWDAAGRREALTRLEHVSRTVAAARALVVAAEQRAGTWALHGDRDLAGFLGRTSGQGRGAGAAQVRQAATLAEMPAVADALVDGPLTVAHVDQLARIAAANPRLAEELSTPDGQARVVAVGGRMDAAEFGKVLQREAARLDPMMVQRAHDEQRRNRGLTIVHTASGTRVSGRMDDVAGRKLAKAIDFLNPRPGADDERSREQRAVDALETMAGLVLSGRAAAEAGSTAPVQGLIVFGEQTWTTLRESRDVDASASVPGATVDLVDRLTDVDTVVDEKGTPVPASQVARALCDCTLTRAVVDARSAPLDLGRGTRRFARQHWLALRAGGVDSCGIDGCGMPMEYCELHHIRWWDRDAGPTAVENCIPLCSYHHHETHRRGLLITRRAAGGWDARHPDGRRYGGTAAPAGDEGEMGLLAVAG